MTGPAFDLAVIGAGTAGLPAAITAARLGAKVVLVEAADRIGGTLHMSSGSFSSGGSAAQAAHGIADSAARHYIDCIKLSHGTANPALLHLWTGHAAAMTDWLHAEGVDLGAGGPRLNPGHELYDVPRTFNMPGGAAAAIPRLADALEPLIASGAVELRLGTRMIGLLTDGEGAVCGVGVEDAGGNGEIRARKVALTTGGYTGNQQLWDELHGPAVPRRTFAWQFARGDGIVAARKLGAMVDYAQHFLPTYGALQDIDDPAQFWLWSRTQPIHRLPWEISVANDGARFMAEDNPSADAREHALLALADHSFWVIYDARIAREAPPLVQWDAEKLARAFATSGNFRSAASIPDLAHLCGLDPARLQRTIAEYNAGVSANADVFGRRHLPAAIAEAPFFAIRHFATSVLTWGGLVVDDRLRVLRGDGLPIPNLHAAGEILGMGVFGHTFLGGSSLSSSLTFGKLLGEWLAPRETAMHHPETGEGMPTC